MMRMNQRGAALGLVMVMAIVIATAIYGLLMMATSHARQAAFSSAALRARYASDAGMVWAYERLREDPTYCAGVGDAGDLDPPPIGGLAVDVVITDCGTANPKIAATTVDF